MVDLGGVAALLVGRHAAGHRLPPHRVNYAAMALGLKTLGVRFCLASAAVGCVHADWEPGTLAVCSDFIDLTGRNLTLFDEAVRHQDFTHPFDPAAREALAESLREADVPSREHAVYVGSPGPRYETPAEIEAIRRMGGDVVGMTASSEAALMREAGVGYACLAVVTNHASGMQSAIGHEEVVEVMKASGTVAVQVLRRAARRLAGE